MYLNFSQSYKGKNAHTYDDFQRGTNKKVQIKSSMAYNFSYPYDCDLDFYIAAHIEPDSRLEILYNGPGKVIHDFLKAEKRKSYKNIWYSITASHLRMLNKQENTKDIIQVP